MLTPGTPQQDKTSNFTFFSVERIRILSRPHGRPRVRLGNYHVNFAVTRGTLDCRYDNP